MRNKNDYVTTAEAAELLGFCQDYVRKMILDGKIKAEKMGRPWVIKIKNLKNITRQRSKRKGST